MARIIGRSTSWLVWILGFLLSFLFGTKRASAQRAQLKYGIIHRPSVDGQPRMPLKPVPTPPRAQAKYGVRPSPPRPTYRLKGIPPMPKGKIRQPRPNGGIRPPHRLSGVKRPPRLPGRPPNPNPTPVSISERAKPLIETYLDPEVGKEQKEIVQSMLKDLGAEGRSSVKAKYEEAKRRAIKQRNIFRKNRTKENREKAVTAVKDAKSLRRLLRALTPRSERKNDKKDELSGVKVRPLRERVVKE